MEKLITHGFAIVRKKHKWSPPLQLNFITHFPPAEDVGIIPRIQPEFLIQFRPSLGLEKWLLLKIPQMLHIFRRGSIQMTVLISETLPGMSWLIVWLGFMHHTTRCFREDKGSLTVENHSFYSLPSLCPQGKTCLPPCEKTPKYNE